MIGTISHCWMQRRAPLLAVAIAIVAVSISADNAWALKPTSPEVKAMIDKGLAFLETAQEGRLGGQCLLGLTELKAGADINHKHITSAVSMCQAMAKNSE